MQCDYSTENVMLRFFSEQSIIIIMKVGEIKVKKTPVG